MSILHFEVASAKLIHSRKFPQHFPPSSNTPSISHSGSVSGVSSQEFALPTSDRGVLATSSSKGSLYQVAVGPAVSQAQSPLFLVQEYLSDSVSETTESPSPSRISSAQSAPPSSPSLSAIPVVCVQSQVPSPVRHKKGKSKRSSWFSNGLQKAYWGFRGKIITMSSAFAGPHKFSDSEVWLLGRLYPALKLNPDQSLHTQSRSHSHSHHSHHPVHDPFSHAYLHQLSPEDAYKEERTQRIRKLLSDFISRLWMTYRKDFPSLAPSSCTSDQGWGCMIRSGQMMLAQGLSCHFLGRDWKYLPDTKMSPAYASLVRCFLDYPDARKYPYSIHNLLYHGRVYDKPIGSWFGPTEVCVMLKRSHDQRELSSPKLIISDNDVLYIEKVRKECQSGPSMNSSRDEVVPLAGNESPLDDDADALSRLSSPTQSATAPITASVASGTAAEEKDVWHSCIILIPLRLGVDDMNPDYYEPLKECFKFPQSLGFMGGKTRQSLYFLGYQDDSVLYLDPHTVQKTVPPATSLEADSSSFHCHKIHSIPWRRVDPSIALGFYCRDRRDFDDFVARAERLKDFKLPLFSISSTTHNYAWNADADDDDDGVGDEANVDVDALTQSGTVLENPEDPFSPQVPLSESKSAATGTAGSSIGGFSDLADALHLNDPPIAPRASKTSQAVGSDVDDEDTLSPRGRMGGTKGGMSSQPPPLAPIAPASGLPAGRRQFTRAELRRRNQPGNTVMTRNPSVSRASGGADVTVSAWSPKSRPARKLSDSSDRDAFSAGVPGDFDDDQQHESESDEEFVLL